MLILHIDPEDKETLKGLKAKILKSWGEKGITGVNITLSKTELNLIMSVINNLIGHSE